MLGCRTYSTSSSPSNIHLIKVEDEFNESIKKVQGKFIAPIIEEQSKKYPHVTTYKIDIDQATLHFFQNGKKVNEVIGANVARLKETMENLYGQ